MSIRNFWYPKTQRCVAYSFARQFGEARSRSFKSFWVLAESLCVRPESKKTLPHSLQGTNAMREKSYPQKCRASSLFSYGFALTRTCFGAIEPVAIGEPWIKLRNFSTMFILWTTSRACRCLFSHVSCNLAFVRSRITFSSEKSLFMRVSPATPSTIISEHERPSKMKQPIKGGTLI